MKNKTFVSSRLFILIISLAGLVMFVLLVPSLLFAEEAAGESGGGSGGTILTDPISGQANTFWEKNAPIPSCLDNWSTWASSTVFDFDADWSSWVVPMQLSRNRESRPGEFFQDFNGDGLVDYMHLNKNYSYYKTTESKYTQDGFAGQITLNTCLALNNGQGWTPAYKCHGFTEVAREGHATAVTTHKFYGDCAKQ